MSMNPVKTDHIASWLADRIGSYVQQPGATIDRDAALGDIGLDSVYVLTLCGDVEDEFGLLVEPTLAWDFPTVNAIAEHLSAELAAES